MKKDVKVSQPHIPDPQMYDARSRGRHENTMSKIGIFRHNRQSVLQSIIPYLDV